MTKSKTFKGYASNIDKEIDQWLTIKTKTFFKIISHKMSAGGDSYVVSQFIYECKETPEDVQRMDDLLSEQT